jgi:hypothetical protein
VPWLATQLAGNSLEIRLFAATCTCCTQLWSTDLLFGMFITCAS